MKKTLLMLVWCSLAGWAQDPMALKDAVHLEPAKNASVESSVAARQAAESRAASRRHGAAFPITQVVLRRSTTAPPLRRTRWANSGSEFFGRRVLTLQPRNEPRRGSRDIAGECYENCNPITPAFIQNYGRFVSGFGRLCQLRSDSMVPYVAETKRSQLKSTRSRNPRRNHGS
jgi:hypothetical protein